MTIRQIIEAVDLAKPNDLEMALKVQWIAELDGKIAADVFLMGYSELGQFQYTHPDSLEKQPLVSFPHDDIYRLWLMAKIDLTNGEYNKYQNTMVAYNESYGVFVRWFARVWKPAQGQSGCFTIREDVPQYYITAYGLALRSGFTGSLEEWFASLKGEPGKSAYEMAVAAGYEGTEEDFSVAVAGVNQTIAYAAAAQAAAEKAEKAAANFETDATLTAEGKAADAKATGKRLEALETEVQPIERGGTGAGSAVGALSALGAMSRTLVEERYGIADAGMTLDETLDYVYDSMADNTNKSVFMYRGTENADRFSLGGGTNWMMLITRATENYGCVIAWQYGAKYTLIKTRSRIAGAWTEWTEHSPPIQSANWPKLWENKAPTSGFEAQKITLNDGYRYSMIAVQFRHSATYGHGSYVFMADNTAWCHYPKTNLGGNNIDETYRYINRINGGTISIQNGYRNGNADKTAAVPVAVYGIAY